MTANDRQILDAMIRYGGSFASHLARAAEVADSDNFAKLEAAFPGIWSHYAMMAGLAQCALGARELRETSP